MKISVLKIREYLVVFFLIFATDSLIICSNDNRLYARISWIMMTVLLLYYILKSKLKIEKQECILILLCMWLIISMVENESIRNVNYYQRIIIILLSLFVTRDIEGDRFINYFISIMRLIALVSLAGFAFHLAIENSKSFPFIMTGNGTIPFKALFFTNIRYGVPINRNFGPFWEPGAYQIYLNWALFYTLNKRNKINILDVLLFSVTILTTKSTAGIIILGLVFICFCLKKERRKSIKKTNYKIIIIVLGIIGFFFIVNNSHLMLVLFDKITSFFIDRSTMNSRNVSTYTRIYGIIADIDIIKRYPLFGIGSGSIKQAIMNSHGLTSNTNSILAMTASYGIAAGVLYFSLFLRAARNQSGFLNCCVYLIMLIAIYSTENLIVSVFSYIVLIYEGKSRKKEKIHYEHRREDYLSWRKNKESQVQIGQSNIIQKSI